MSDTAEPPRQVWHFLLLVPVAFALLASALLSGRPVLLASFNNVALAGPAPAAVVPDFGSDWSAIVHRSDWRAPIAQALGHPDLRRPPRLGWPVRQWSFLSLPLGAYRQGPLLAAKEDGYGYRLYGLTDEQIGAIDRAGATPWYPWWRYGWGWLVIACVAAFAWAELRWQARRREMLGLI